MKIVVVGTGYVGLVTGTCLAEIGNTVICVDVDQMKIDGLMRGVMPIYEPGLEPLVIDNIGSGRLRFTTSLQEAMAEADVYFIAVGTPPNPDGSANLDFVLNVAREIGKHLQHYVVIVDKSTVPIGTAERVRNTIARELVARKAVMAFDVVSNPEFLKEGSAVDDFMRPDRIVVGTESQQAAAVMQQIYAPLNAHENRLLLMGTRDAEMTKYAANAMLATKISFINEIACLCDEMGVDVENVRQGIGSDSRIGYSFLHPGCGYGGSCFPKDVNALVQMAAHYNFDPKVLKAVETRNAAQKEVLIEKLLEICDGNLSGVTVAVWGLAFKPETDDIREASSMTLIGQLVAAGARVRVYDPVAMDEARRALPEAWFDAGQVVFTHDQYEALKGADALALVTEWHQFRNPDFPLMRNIMNRPMIVDGRNVYDPKVVTESGFDYIGVGRRRKAIATGEPQRAASNVVEMLRATPAAA